MFGILSQLDSSLRRIFPVYLALLLWNVTWTISINGPVLPLYVESLGIDVVGWSALASAFALGMFLLEWVWGSLSDSVDRQRLMLLSVLCMSVLFALYSIHGNVAFFIVLQLLSGAIGVIVGPTTRTYVSDESAKKSIGLYASLWWTFHTVGRAIGPLIGTYVAQTWSFDYSFYASSVLSIGLALVILVSFPSDKERQRMARRMNIVSGLKSIMGMRSARFLFLSAIFAFMGLSVIRSFLPLYASERINMSTLEIGVLLASVSGVQLVTMPSLGWLSDKYGRKRMAVMGFILSSCLFLLYFLVNTSFQLFLVSIAVGVGLSGTSLLLSMIPDVTPSSMCGTAVGIYGSFEDLGTILGPLVYGFIWSAYGSIFIFAASSITQLVAAGLVYAIEQNNRYGQPEEDKAVKA